MPEDYCDNELGEDAEFFNRASKMRRFRPEKPLGAGQYVMPEWRGYGEPEPGDRGND